MWKYLVKYGLHGEFSNKNDIFFQDIERGKLKLHLFGIDHFTETGITLKDGTHITCTDVLLSTGYKTQFDIIDHPVAKKVAGDMRNNLFHMINPELRDTLVWIGYVRPDVGGVPAIAELQARYYARLLAKKVSLPDNETLCREIIFEKKEEKSHFVMEPDKSENVKYFNITNSLAKKIGAKTAWYRLLLNPSLMFYYYHGSMVASQFRLSGPGSDYKSAKEVIKKVGITSAPVSHLIFFISLTTTLSLLSPLLRKVFKWTRVTNKDANKLNKYSSAKHILNNQWPGFPRTTIIRDGDTIKSLFSNDYEYEGFKFFLVDNYQLDSHVIGMPSLTVKMLDDLINGEKCQSALVV
ncbi:hypothetical protein HJ010_00490 [Vibrio parahaemolyticus]|nr:hypothetical protein [Vibrio parahaemolyticus]